MLNNLNNKKNIICHFFDMSGFNVGFSCTVFRGLNDNIYAPLIFSEGWVLVGGGIKGFWLSGMNPAQ